MGCDIHWILERRHQDGAWEAVQSDCRYWTTIHDDRGDPRRVLDTRSYAAFARLSGVRGAPPPEGPVAVPGLPADLSPWTRRFLEGPLWSGNHSAGHLGPDALPALLHPDTAAFRGALLDLLASPLSAAPLPDLVEIGDRGGFGQFADLVGAESAHARLAREARGAGLLPIGLHGAWRLLLSYDN